MKKFIIASLLAAGFASNSDALEKSITSENDINSKSKIDVGINTLIERDLPFTLLAHSSHSSHYSHSSHSSHYSNTHSSHASHSSHYSHQSFGGLNYGYESEKEFAKAQKNEGLGRNINSTPADSILPRSPAIVKVNFEKEKIKGSSKTFVILTQRVQLALYGMGYYTGLINGQMNNELKASISKYQSKHNLKVTGSLTDELLGYLNVKTKINKN